MKVELYHEDNLSARRSVTASVDEGDFVIETGDIGSPVEAVWDESDYEFRTSVPRTEWGRLLVALAAELYDGEADATDKLRGLCARYGIRCQWGW